jgi:hypothetical protein
MGSPGHCLLAIQHNQPMVQVQPRIQAGWYFVALVDSQRSHVSLPPAKGPRLSFYLYVARCHHVAYTFNQPAHDSSDERDF